jgi:hypothetical protein
MALNRVSPMAFSPTELALVELNGLVRTDYLVRAALQVYQLCFSAEHTPVRVRVFGEVIFLMDLVGRFAAQDVIHTVQNLLEGDVILLEP